MNISSSIKKIFIDPGHVGNSFFDFRYFKMDDIEFHEGDFCFVWAEVLQRALLGKIEHSELSRNKGQPSIVIANHEHQIRMSELINSIGTEAALKNFRVPKNFFPLKTTDQLLEAAVQNEADLINRAGIASEQKFDLCLSLHLNGDPTSLKTEKNGICGFTNYISKTHYLLFEKIIKNISIMTGLPIFKIEQLDEVSTGVFVDESLTLLKNISIPTLLIEGPFQNNPSELLLLNQSLNQLLAKGKVEGRLEQLTKAIVSSI